MMTWNVYLSGEIHSDWRQQIIDGAKARDLPITFSSAVTDHEASDAAGDVLGSDVGGPTRLSGHGPELSKESSTFFRDHQSAKVNAIRTRTLLEKCDVAVVRFGDKYKQWNAAFDAGYCAALGKPYITLHDEAIVHALKEVDAAALAWAKTPGQVVEVLSYVVSA
jgi:YtoQ family protein